MKRTLVYLILSLFLVAESTAQGLTVNDTLIARDSVHSMTYDEQTVWCARRVLMEKLLHDTSLVAGDTITAFFNAYKNDNIGKLSVIRLGLNTLQTIDSTTAVEIQNNLTLIESNASNIDFYDSIRVNDATLTSVEIAEIDDLLQGYNDAISIYTSANDSIFNLKQTIISIKAMALKSGNDALTTTKVYEQNEMDVNSVYLATVAQGMADSVINYATPLYDIARQCPLEGGPAVFLARSLYNLVNDSVIYDDDRRCNSPNDTCLVPEVPGLISGRRSGVCDSQFHYTIDTVLTATGYTWSVTGAAVIDSGQGSAEVWVTFTDSFTVGTINVFASNACGAGSKRSISATGYPDVPVILGTSLVCSFESGVLFSLENVEGATIYTWFVPPGCTIDSGQGTPNIYVQWDSLPGTVMVVVANNCGVLDTVLNPVEILACRLSQSITQSGSKGNASGSIKMYPNPTTGKVTVSYKLNSNKGLLQLYDVVGKLAGQYELNGDKSIFEFDAAHLCCGIFYFRVIDQDIIAGQGKLVIVK